MPYAISRYRTDLPAGRLPSRPYDIFVKPYHVALEYFKAISITLKLQLVYFSWDTFSIKTISLYFLAGMALMLPIINSIVFAILCRHSPDFLPHFAENEPRNRNKLPPLPLHLQYTSTMEFLELEDKLLAHVFSYLDLTDFDSLRKIKAIADRPGLWNAWAQRLKLPGEAANEEKIRQIMLLLKYFAVHPRKKTLTIFKRPDANSEDIQTALKLYPEPAWLLIWKPETNTESNAIPENKFDFYFREADGKVIVYNDLTFGKPGDYLEPEIEEIGVITNDSEYRKIKPSERQEDVNDSK